MPAEGRPITRPRQSFSCVVCRRRKVRCGREQPACSNCVRIRETCEYEADILSKPAAHPDPKPTASPFHANARKINTSTQDHGEYAGIGTDTGDQSAQFPNNSCSSPASSSSLHGGGSSRNSSTRISIQTLPSSTGDPIFTPPPPQGTYYQPENNSHWRTPVSDGQGQLGRLSSTTAPSQTTQHVTQHNIHDLSRKRPRSSGYTEQSDGALEEARGEPDTFFDGERNACAFTGEGERANHRVHGYLSVRNGGQTRYVSEAFWASLKGHEELCETALGERLDVPENVPLPHIDSLGLAKLLTTLPPKPVCDILLECFSINVFPIHPMVHWATLQTDYDNFWQWCRNSDISQPDNKLLGDPTFLCLLFSTLYCGASTAPPMLWSSQELKETSPEHTLAQLEKTYHASLESCQALVYPTIYTLTASLFAHSCSKAKSNVIADLRFVSSSLRIARVMGLHRDGASFGLGRIECEMRRRAWWHIIWLDVQAGILHGSSVYCGYSSLYDEVAMVTDVQDEQLSSTMAGSLPAPSTTSITMLCSIGRFEVARFNHSFLYMLSRTKHEENTLPDNVINSARSLQEKLDKLIARLPIQGIPETGFVPSRYHNASPSTHQSLYRDNPSSPTIWSSWVRILLGLLKTEVTISVQKSFLNRANEGAEQRRVWESIVRSCITYLRNFMQITQIPAFAPYSWYCLKHHAPLQCVFLLLTYLQHNRQSQHAHLARYYVDEVIDVFTSKERLVVPENSNRKIVGTEAKSETKPRSPAWSILVDLRYKIDISPHAKPPLFKPTVPIRCQPVPSALALHTISLSIGEKPHEAVTQEAKSGPGIVETSRASTTEPRLSSTRSTTVNDPHVNQINPTDLEQLLDLSHMDTWSSDSLSKVPEDFLLAHEDFLDFDNNLHMHDSLGHASYA